MKAVQFTGAGGPEVVRYGDIPEPEPGRDQILVRVHAASVNAADWKIREGLSRAVVNPSYPITPGWDLSGTVAAVGEGVTGIDIGESVVGILPVCGSFAEYALLSSTVIAPKPARLTHVEAAALPAAGMTAWFGLFHRGGLQAGQRVLIHAAAGGVGHLAVQLARHVDAYVIATASAANLDFVRAMGAHEVIDYSREPFEKLVRDVDLVFDLVGGTVETRSWETLKPGGILVSALRPLADADIPAGKRGTLVRVAPNSDDLRAIMSLANAGKLIPNIRKVFPLREAGDAIELSRTGRGRGRIVIDIVDST